MRNIIPFLFLFLFASCFDLDDNLFNPDNSITEYLFDDFDGFQEIDADSINVPQDQIHLFTLDVGTENEKIYCVYLGDTNTINTDSVIVYCHGNAGHLDFYWPRVKLLANVGGQNRYGVLMMDYRGYGLSDGEASESNMYEDVETNLEWLKTKGLTNDRLFMYGFSLGSAPVCELTANTKNMSPSKILLESPFASVDVMVQDGSGLALPKSFFTNLEINNADEIKSINSPLYWIHGVDDDFLNMQTHGELVFQNHNGSYKEAHRIESANHDDVPFVMGYEEYMNSIQNFLIR